MSGQTLLTGKCSVSIARTDVRANPRSLTLPLDVLQKRPTTPTLKNFAINYLETHTKSFDYTLSVLENLEGQIREEIARLGSNDKLEKIIDGLSVRKRAAKVQTDKRRSR